MALFTLLASLLLIHPGSAQEQRVLLGRGDTLAGWVFGSPGGNSSLTLSNNDTVVPWSNLPYLNVTYDFAPGGWQAVISPEDVATLDVPGATALCFSIFRPGPDGESMLVQLVDATGANRGSWPYLTSPGWNNLTLPFNASDWDPHSNSTLLPLPLKGLSIGAGKGNEHTLLGWLGIADVYLLTSAPPGSVPRPVVMDLVQPTGLGDGVVVVGGQGGGQGGSLPPQAPLVLGVQVVNRLQEACAVNISVALRNSTGPMGEGVWAPCAALTTLGPWESTTLACTIDPTGAPPGYLVMRALFSSAACWSPSDMGVAVEGALSLVPPQPPYTPLARNRHVAVFGGQMESSALAAAAIGMWSVRSGPLWEWSQPSECWDPLECFHWEFYDGVLRLAEAGIEVMLDARELAPPWASARNDSGPTWASIPGPPHYPDYVRWLGLMLDRYGGSATMVEVSNEDDGLAFFMPYALPYDYTVNLSLALINLTIQGMAAASPASVAGLQLVGLSSSSFDVKQTGNGGSQYMQYERAVLGAPGVIGALDAVSLHPYQNHVWVPWTNPGWGNFSFQFFNESAGPGTNSTVAQLLATAALMKEVAAATPGMPPDYKPVLRPSEWGYNLIATVALSEGWALMHAALVAQGLVHFRSAPLSEYVDKAFYFAACDSCCPESNGFFGLWRGAQERTGPNATSPGQGPARILPTLVPLPSVSAHAQASVLLDVPSGRSAGQWVVDHSVDGGMALPGSGSSQLPPSCVAFAPDPASPLKPPPLIVLFILGHHFNDRTTATLTLEAPPGRVVSGLGAVLPVQAVEGAGGAVTIPLSLAALPTYVELAQGADPVAACEALTWD